MKILALPKRTLALLAVIIPLLGLFIYVALRSGPLAPVAVTVESVSLRAVTPALFGIGTVEARFTYKIGPTMAGRIKHLEVNVGDSVSAGQILGEMEPVDLDERVLSQNAALKRAEAALREAESRQAYAKSQLHRYEQLFAVRMTSEELLSTKRQEWRIAEAALSAAEEELARAGADRAGAIAQRSNLRLIAPVDGVIIAREAEVGTTLVAGQLALEIIDPKSFWINVRFDQMRAAGLGGGLPAQIVLRSRNGQSLKGRVLRVEPKADAITEEMLAKVIFDAIPQPLPRVGELAEVTVQLPALAPLPTIINAAVRREGGRVGVWKMVNGELIFSPVKLGTADLDGYVQVLAGLSKGDKVVTYSEKPLKAKSRIRVVESISGVPR